MFDHGCRWWSWIDGYQERTVDLPLTVFGASRGRKIWREAAPGIWWSSGGSSVVNALSHPSMFVSIKIALSYQGISTRTCCRWFKMMEKQTTGTTSLYSRIRNLPRERLSMIYEKLINQFKCLSKSWFAYLPWQISERPGARKTISRRQDS